MRATAKVFTNGNSQAVRLPKAFRVNAHEMWISRNEVTGEIVLRPKDAVQVRQRRLQDLMAAISDNPLPSNFLSEDSRHNPPQQDPFEPGQAQTPVSAATSRTASAKQLARQATGSRVRAKAAG